MADDPMSDSARLVSSLFSQLCSGPGEQDCARIETHISWVLLVGDTVYKIKKPVDLGFLDFSALSQRQFFCEEELRLNRRLAPDIYQAVRPITGDPDHPVLAGDGPAIEYAVQMRRFPQSAQLDHMLEQHRLTPGHIDAIAVFIADFHARADIAEPGCRYGEPQAVMAPVRENFVQIGERLDAPALRTRLDALVAWSEQTGEALTPHLERRKQQGFIRECHGDLHLRNLAWYPDRPLAFDCLEFDPALRWIDVISEVAFLVMDLQSRGEPALAQRFLNRYLERSGDYDGLALLPFYLAYRALVRAKVSLISETRQGDASAHEAFLRYLDLAGLYTLPPQPRLLITFGPSASGKSTLTQPLLEELGAIRLRSDVERKRLCGIDAQQHAGAAAEKGIYDPTTTERTYARLAELAESVLEAGYPVIVDATFADPRQRERFRELAQRREVPFHILDFQAPPTILRQRIRARRGDVSDADMAVLEHQLAGWSPLAEEESPHRIVIDTTRPFSASRVLEAMGLEIL